MSGQEYTELEITFKRTIVSETSDPISGELRRSVTTVTDHTTQQMVVPGGPSSSYTAPLDPYPPPTPYYPGYTPGPGPACYTHPPNRNLALLEQTYQSCSCPPVQLYPKNVHIGPLTGECKRPGVLPLPPVTLQLPPEPSTSAEPPSPARGSAGMPRQPSPLSTTSRPGLGSMWEMRPPKVAPERKWQERPKATPVRKWEEPRAIPEFNPVKYKTEATNYVDIKEVWDLSKKRTSTVTTSQLSEKPDDDQEKIDRGAEDFAQRLLAIRSHGLTRRTEPEATVTSPDFIKDGREIKTENVTPPINVVEAPEAESSSQKRSLSSEDSDESLKRQKVEETGEVFGSPEEESVNRKRKAETEIKDLEDEITKAKKTVVIAQKDESACEDQAIINKNDVTSKETFSENKNETVEKDLEQSTIDVLETITKTEIEESDKVEEESKTEIEVEKIDEPTSSTKEESEDLPTVEENTGKKSKSRSQSRSKERESSAIKQPKEAAKKKSQNAKKSKGKGKKRSDSHSKTTKGGKKPGRGGKSSGAGRSAQAGSSKSKKTKAEPVPSTSKKTKRTVAVQPRAGVAPKWSNGWSFDGEPFDAKVYLNNDEPPVMRKCYLAMRHVEGDVIRPKDCILLKAGSRRTDLPFIAKVAALWENPDDGEMMVSLLWYYRPEHTEQGRQPSDHPDEIFASRHKDTNSVACIEDKCFVLTYNEYCRYRKNVRRIEEGVAETQIPVPNLEQPYFRIARQPPCVMAPDMVFFCRRVYDFRQRRLLKNPS